MGEKTSGVGHFCIPTAPAIGTTVAQSASANTYTATYVQLSAAAPAAIFITGVYVQLAAGASIPTYMSVQLATGGAGSEAIVGQHNIGFGPTSGVAATAWGIYKPIYPPIPVANAIRIAAKTASSVASALSWAVTLECINQSNVVDDGVAVGTVTTVTNQLTAAQIATGVWQDATAGDFTTASSIGKSLYTSGVVPGGSGGLFISGTNAGTTTFGALTVTGATTHTGNMVLSDGLTISAPSTGNRAGLDITGNGTGAAMKLAAGATGKGIAITTTAGDGLSILPTAGSAIVATGNGTSKHGIIATGGTAGTSDGATFVAGTGGVDFRANQTGSLTGNISGSVGSVTGAVGSVTGLTASNLDAAVSSRMATYTQPTGFLAATFPTGTVANTTNITAGTITTVTNLTNAPTAGDFTATMKTSITTAATAATPTAAAVTGAVGSVTGNVGGNVVGSVASVTAAVTLPSIPANWITAAGINAAALNGKGDWLLSSSYTAPASAVAIRTEIDANSTGLAAIFARTDVATSTRLSTVGYTAPDNTSITGIKAKTDSLTFTSPGRIDANVLAVNGTTISGAGTAVSPWGP